MPESNGYIVAAYVVTWVVILGYALRLVRVTRQANEQLERASRSGAGSET
jgi:CcmD family protein